MSTPTTAPAPAPSPRRPRKGPRPHYIEDGYGGYVRAYITGGRGERRPRKRGRK